MKTIEPLASIPDSTSVRAAIGQCLRQLRLLRRLLRLAADAEVERESSIKLSQDDKG